MDISEEQLTAALKLGIIDERAGSFTEGVRASVVIIATPVAQTLKMLDVLAASDITHELLITDVGNETESRQLRRQSASGSLSICRRPSDGGIS